MKTMIFYPVILFAALVLVVTWASGRRASAEEQREGMTLPKSCTLMSMKPAERAVHLERLGMLRRSMSDVTVLPEGFSFEVDLSKMPLNDLQGWTENEQKCCAQLKIDSQIVETGKRASVRVVCDEGLKTELMQIFGLKAGE